MADTDLKIVISAINKSGAAFSQLSGQLDGLKNAAIKVGVALAGALAIRDVLDTTKRLGEEIDQLRDTFGLTGETASRLNYNLRVVGSSADEFTTSVTYLNRHMIDSIQLAAQGKDDFAKWGISIFNANKTALRPTGEILAEISQKMIEAGHGQAQLGIANDLLGKSAGRLIDYLTLSKEELAAMAKEAEDFGLILSDAGVDSLEQFQRKLNTLGLQFDGLKLQLAQYLIPILQRLMRAFRENGGVIKVLAEVLRGALGILKSFAEWVGNVLDNLKGLLGTVGSVELATDALVLVLAAMAGGPVLVAIAAVVLAFLEVQKTIKFVQDNWDKFVYALTTGQLNDIPFFGFFFEKAQFVIEAIGLMNDAFATAVGWLGNLGRLWDDFLTTVTGRGIGGAPGTTGGSGGSGFGPGAGAGGGVGGGGGGFLPDRGEGHRAPDFAVGGIVTRPTYAHIGEAGPEAVIPLSRMGGMGGITINIAGSVDSRDTAKYLAEQVAEQIVRRMRGFGQPGGSPAGGGYY